jgi:predicted Zn-dependent peptidase
MRKLLLAVIGVALFSVASHSQDELLKIDVKEKILDNGLKVLVVERHGTPDVACRIFFKVGSWFDIPVEYTGMFLCSFQTKAKSVAFAVSIVMEEVNRIRTEIVSEKDLKGAKDLYIERFPSLFSGRGSSAYAKVKVLAGNEYNKRPLDYYEHYRDNYRKVTREKVLEVAKKYLNPDGLKVVVVGKIKEMKKGDGQHKDRLEDFGEVKQLEPPDLMR